MARDRDKHAHDRDPEDTHDRVTQVEDRNPHLLVGDLISDEENERRGRWVRGV